MVVSVRSLLIRSCDGLTRLRTGGGRLLVLIYHRVLPIADAMYPHDPDVALFREQMRALREDFRVLPLGEALERLPRGTLPAGAVAITFDDGFADNHDHALPVLRDLQMSATFFVASGHLGAGAMFNDVIIEACRRAPAGGWDTGVPSVGRVELRDGPGRCRLAYRLIAHAKYLPGQVRHDFAQRLLDATGAGAPRGLMMSPDQVRALRAAGMTIGGHTRSHPILANLGDAEAALEIAGGKADLEAILGEPITLFAYPNGAPGRDYSQRDVRLVGQAGFQGAVTTARGFADRSASLLEMPRVATWDRSAWRFSARLALERAIGRGALRAPAMAQPG